jgi:hypothetical protein
MEQIKIKNKVLKIRAFLVIHKYVTTVVVSGCRVSWDIHSSST